VGGVSFVAGFFGPIIFAPEANQGPLLGLFITGPLGAIVGAVGGGVFWLARGKRGSDDLKRRGAVQQGDEADEAR
jgi:hypothetical protein